MKGSLPDAGVGRGLSLMFQKHRRTHTDDSSDARLVYIKKEKHNFKWVDEALFDEIHRMDDHQARITEEIEDLRSSMKKTIEEEVMKQKNLLHVGCVGSILSILCLWSKCD
ncbi:hypothetical protein F2Q69_00048704 [Brassica cretica]|uniref:Uncharacterized protein n=1 Tax=Brassica cretica TaxID=69181 RepID=A0A8S9Q121_BRACR|nr:hypothetical protein F2Q69_00048704 [Brassica cretica]